MRPDVSVGKAWLIITNRYCNPDPLQIDRTVDTFLYAGTLLKYCSEIRVLSTHEQSKFWG